MDLKSIQQQVDTYIGQFKEGYFPPLVNLARLTEEVGELARELNHLYGPKKKKADEPEGDVALELADIFFVLVVLANQMNIDLDEAVGRTMRKYEVRDADRWERKAERST
jgi:NTP pyrophosphatase (non-canonical NTP hydrolase)